MNGIYFRLVVIRLISICNLHIIEQIPLKRYICCTIEVHFSSVLLLHLTKCEFILYLFGSCLAHPYLAAVGFMSISEMLLRISKAQALKYLRTLNRGKSVHTANACFYVFIWLKVAIRVFPELHKTGNIAVRSLTMW